MEKVNTIFQRMNLKKALLTISAIILVMVTMLSVSTILVTDHIRQDILNTRTITFKGSGVEFELEQNEKRQSIKYEVNPENYTYGKLSAENQIHYYILTFLMIALPILYVIAGAFAVVKFYYKMKLSLPIKELRSGIEHISGYDLDFQIKYDSEDELGMLCSTFEDMRKELYRNNQKMWGMLQERKALTASVSHDLRTPITVIKGYVEYLERAKAKGKLSEEMLDKTIQSMAQSIERLERYVDCIRDIQKMEDIEIEKTSISATDFIGDLKEEFSILMEQSQKEFVLNNQSQRDRIYTDKNMLFKVLENLLNNALRFSESRIIFTVADCEEQIDFTVQDDGKGFSRDELENAIALFYSSANGKENFGIGLSICRILCEKLGGNLLIKNNADGGACVIARIKAI